ncbi:hypothetical protein Bcoa_2005 [Heyndrickxia coagulans 36D1]|uniref:Uncharacterized protein n=1 Tax=Heyndrickxia coagulans 36D1 TaxID=345219 RepID=G2TMW6_HEYCO|nr:hypothetical protein Bcoa_2005 [Heyndrickxia coagulans 36D1]
MNPLIISMVKGGCVLVEALKSITRGKERIIEEISVIDHFENGNAACIKYCMWKIKTGSYTFLTRIMKK